MSERAPSDQDVRQHFTGARGDVYGRAGRHGGSDGRLGCARTRRQGAGRGNRHRIGRVCALAAEITGSGACHRGGLYGLPCSRVQRNSKRRTAPRRMAGRLPLRRLMRRAYRFPMVCSASLRAALASITSRTPFRPCKRWARVLAPGGRLVIGEFGMPEDPQKAAYFNRMERTRGHSHVQAFSESQLRRMMADSRLPGARRSPVEERNAGERVA